jgi:ribosome-interacting GTPase 1
VLPYNKFKRNKAIKEIKKQNKIQIKKKKRKGVTLKYHNKFTETLQTIRKIILKSNKANRS